MVDIDILIGAEPGVEEIFSNNNQLSTKSKRRNDDEK
jgi:hypothetical protein